MSIIKVIRRDNPFAQIDKSVFEDTAISWKAKGILGYLLTKPNDWKVNVADIVKRSPKSNGQSKKGNGEDAVYQALKELRGAGYARLIIKREKGVIIGTEWEVSEVKFEKPDTVLPDRDNPDTAKPDTDNPDYSNNESSNNDLSDINKEIEPPKPPKETAVFTLEESTDEAVKWCKENAPTVQMWMETARIKKDDVDLKSEIMSFFSHYRKGTADIHEIRKNPVGYFKEGFYGWLAKSKQFQKNTPGAARQNLQKTTSPITPIIQSPQHKKMPF